jgi:hypothetical protein
MTKWTGEMFGYFILAAIFGALFFGALIHGIIMHFSGFLEVALVLYFVAIILGGIAKMCVWKFRDGCCGVAPKRKR